MWGILDVSTVEQFDDIILGGGKGGKSLALALAPAGHKVALIERGMIGGACINVACIPTKTTLCKWQCYLA
jgi:pyruvate/2-oxoglutarate dehydrogenase complex dihydrolipoamide dehydrogenase (E3) component